MSRDRQRLLDDLAHILEAIERIDRRTADIDEVGVLGNALVPDAVVRNLEIVGEAWPLPISNTTRDSIYAQLLKGLL